jgi:DNA/RNA endonuclease YhcR with UshA esterase domain
VFPLTKVKHSILKIDSTHVSKHKKNKDLHKVISPKDPNEIKCNSCMHKVM